jgi:hypothetical protein
VVKSITLASGSGRGFRVLAKVDLGVSSETRTTMSDDALQLIKGMIYWGKKKVRLFFVRLGHICVSPLCMYAAMLWHG